MSSQARVLMIIRSRVLRVMPVYAEIQLILLGNDESQEFKTFEIRTILGDDVFALKQHYLLEHEALEKYEKILEGLKKSPENKKGESDGPAHKGTEK